MLTWRHNADGSWELRDPDIGTIAIVRQQWNVYPIAEGLVKRCDTLEIAKAEAEDLAE